MTEEEESDKIRKENAGDFSAAKQRRSFLLKYCCTRNSSERVTAAQAIAQGISADGGLFVPESLPVYTYDDLTALSLSSYTERAAKILSDFLPEFTAEELLECAQAAYASEKFSGDSPALCCACARGALAFITKGSTPSSCASGAGASTPPTCP